MQVIERTLWFFEEKEAEESKKKHLASKERAGSGAESSGGRSDRVSEFYERYASRRYA